MALELFKPFVIGKLVQEGYIQNVKNATRLIERGEPEVWDVLERVTKEKFVLLNRAPTLHRLGVQAFRPVLIEGKAIQLHPLVCYAFNADFDGDQMAVHVPLSSQSVWEAGEIMRSSHNLLKPASGEPVVTPRLDMIFGCYWLTSYEEGVRGEGKIYSGKNEAILAHHMGSLHPRAKIKVRMKRTEDQTPELVETSVGRILFNNELPKELRYRDEIMDSKGLKRVVHEAFVELGRAETAAMVDRIKRLGFEQALLSGMTFSMADLWIPSTKDKRLQEAQVQVAKILEQYQMGLITENERRRQIIRIWNNTRDELGGDIDQEFPTTSPVSIATTSGARGSTSQLNQMAGMIGLVVNPTGDIIETPITSNYKEGLSELEYFISTHGARKGSADTALRTSDSGYLTRRLVDVAQDVIVTKSDCGTPEGRLVTKAESEALDISFADRIIGRVAAQPVKSGRKTLLKAGEIITKEAAQKIAENNIDNVIVRSPMTCENDWGICQHCYGRDLATGKLVELGEVVGIVAAQAIGEPGTQLTLKTFHSGGLSGEDITTGLPRVEELFEARSPKSPAVMADIDGTVRIKERKSSRVIELTADSVQRETYELKDGYEASIKNGEIVKPRQSIATAANKRAIRASIGGRVTLKEQTLTIESTEPMREEYTLAPNQTIRVQNGQKVTKSEALTEGHLDLQKILKYQGLEAAQRYIISEIQSIYLSQGQEINDKHIEIILRQMFSKVHILNEGDTKLLPGQVMERRKVEKKAKKLSEKKKQPPVFEPMLFGVTRVALTTESFLSAASFQETTSVLINAAVRGAVDPLQGLKENVIIGRLIPAGTGFRKRR